MKHYERRLLYPRSDTLAAAFPEMEAVAMGSDTTTPIRVLRDQPELHSQLLARISEMSLDVTDVRPG
ncbi:hypothetical protein [Arthrobacter sp. Leaf69]|uniref:hypothetical protein n=1 Tax=Arthrobacter sp. Leaf69 TaxID=1736232 RepID=UPI0006F228AA|nr:hypothetical protein [Arthrobacter sp. Leaf69]KQN86586.1 hypothetical protein ASE96_13555 [Arthrobacter sp. Leaf69]